MKFTIKKEEKEKDVRLELQEGESGINLVGYDSEGEVWDIMGFRDGTFRRYTSIGPSVGLELDDKGRIKEK